MIDIIKTGSGYDYYAIAPDGRRAYIGFSLKKSGRYGFYPLSVQFAGHVEDVLARLSTSGKYTLTLTEAKARAHILAGVFHAAAAEHPYMYASPAA